MQLHTFRGNSMAEALGAVKKALGKDASIVHTRTFKVGGVMGVGGKDVVEIIAAVTTPTAASRPASRQTRPLAPAQAARAVARAYEPVPALAAALALSPAPVRRAEPREPAEVMHVRQRRADASPPIDHVQRQRELAAMLRRSARAPDAPDCSVPTPFPSPPSPREPEPAAPAPPSLRLVQDADAPLAAAPVSPFTHGRPPEHPVAALSDELAAIKGMLGRIMQGSPAAAGGGGADLAGSGPLFSRYLKLLENDVSRELADRVIGEVRQDLSPSELTNEHLVNNAILRRLSSLIPTSSSSVEPGRSLDGRPFTLAMIGPTGVGKTTTTAKLAAAYRLKLGRRVGLITTDTYRIAAVEQLRTYADIIGVPLKVATCPEEMSQACAAFADLDIVLIDTAGRSPRDSARLNELRAFLDAADPHETHLVLSSASGEASLLEAARRFAVAAPNRVIFTKLDEAVTYGVMLNVAHQVGSALSFVTTGQEVPDHIEAGRSDRLARLLLDVA